MKKIKKPKNGALLDHLFWTTLKGEKLYTISETNLLSSMIPSISIIFFAYKSITALSFREGLDGIKGPIVLIAGILLSNKLRKYYREECDTLYVSWKQDERVKYDD